MTRIHKIGPIQKVGSYNRYLVRSAVAGDTVCEAGLVYFTSVDRRRETHGFLEAGGEIEHSSQCDSSLYTGTRIKDK